MHLGRIFFTLTVVVWTSVAVWLCYSGPPVVVGGTGSCEVSALDGARGDLADSLLARVGGADLGGAGRVAICADGADKFLSLSANRKGGLDELTALAGTVAGAKREALEDFLKQLQHPSSLGLRREEKLAAINAAAKSRGKLTEGVADGEDGSSRPSTMLSMAEHVREIGNKYFQDRHFAAAVHCYEVACLLCPQCPQGGNAGSLAAYHCNCALACLELGRYGDAVNECNAALVLMPPRHLTVKALYRLAVAHAYLKDPFEARRCLSKCLELDPENEYVLVFLRRLGDEEEATWPTRGGSAAPGRLAWIELPKKLLCAGAASRERAKLRKAKAKVKANDASAPDDVDSLNGQCQARLDREAGLWHTMARHNSKLYILGGLSDAAGTACGLLGAGASSAPSGKVEGGGHLLGACRGSDELHVLDVDSFELRQLSGNSKPPHPCCCHTATVVGTNMVVFGGIGSPPDQPPLLMIFDMLQAKWRVPTTTGIPPRQRQGHTTNAVQGDRFLCVFGGIEPTTERRVARVYNDTHVLDLQSLVWRKLDVGGRRPPARFGHTATNLPGSSGRLLIIGGRDHLATPCGASVPSESPARDPTMSRGFTGLHVLDTDRRCWVQQPTSGSPPLHAFYHSVCVVDDATLLVLPSGAGTAQAGAGQATMRLHVLDLNAWRWSVPQAPGPGPAPRVGHCAAASGGRVYVFGGAVRGGSAAQLAIDKSVYVLEVARHTQAEQDAKAPASRDAVCKLLEEDKPKGVVASTPTNGKDLKKRGSDSSKGEAMRCDPKAVSSALQPSRASAPADCQTEEILASTQVADGAAPAPAVPTDRGGARGSGRCLASVGSSPEACCRQSGPTAPASASPSSAGAARKSGQPGDSPKRTPTPPAGPASPEVAFHDSPTSLRSVPKLEGSCTAHDLGDVKHLANSTTSSTPDACDMATGGEASTATGSEGTRSSSRAGGDAAQPTTEAERIELMLSDNGFDEDDFDDDGMELSFEELLEKEKAFFQKQAEKGQLSFPRAKDSGNGKKNQRF